MAHSVRLINDARTTRRAKFFQHTENIVRDRIRKIPFKGKKTKKYSALRIYFCNMYTFTLLRTAIRSPFFKIETGPLEYSLNI